MHIELTRTTTLDDISHGGVDNELHLDVRAHVEGHIHIHHTTDVANLTALTLVGEHTTGEECRSIGALNLCRAESHEVGIRYILLTRKRHVEV